MPDTHTLLEGQEREAEARRYWRFYLGGPKDQAVAIARKWRQRRWEEVKQSWR